MANLVINFEPDWPGIEMRCGLNVVKPAYEWLRSSAAEGSFTYHRFPYRITRHEFRFSNPEVAVHFRLLFGGTPMVTIR